MSQPTAISSDQLIQYRERINRGGLAEVRAVYAELKSLGYSYAGWGQGQKAGRP